MATGTILDDDASRLFDCGGERRPLKREEPLIFTVTLDPPSDDQQDDGESGYREERRPPASKTTRSRACRRRER